MRGGALATVMVLIAGVRASVGSFPPVPLVQSFPQGIPALRASLRGGAPVLSRMQKRLFQDLSRAPGIYSADEPAEHLGREDKHIPTITITETGAEVFVNHVMDDNGPEKDLHYIEFIWLIDQDTGECLAARNLFPGDGVEAKAIFKGQFAQRYVTPYAM